MDTKSNPRTPSFLSTAGVVAQDSLPTSSNKKTFNPTLASIRTFQPTGDAFFPALDDDASLALTAAPSEEEMTSSPTPSMATAAPTPSIALTATPSDAVITLSPTPSMITAAPTPSVVTEEPTSSMITSAPSSSTTILSATQSVNGVSLAAYQADSETFDGIFASSISDTLGHDIAASDVTILSVDSEGKRALTAGLAARLLWDKELKDEPDNKPEDKFDKLDLDEAADDDDGGAAVPTFAPTALVSSAISLSYNVDIANATGFSSYEDALDACTDTLESAVISGNFTATLQTYAAQSNSTAFVDVSSGSITIASPTVTSSPTEEEVTAAPSSSTWTAAPTVTSITTAPTDEPTLQLTDQPTEGGTSNPTIEPTSVSTDSPSSEPSSAPTEAATFGPSSDPSLAPTEEATFGPSSDPSSAPTEAATLGPTSDPSSAPTDAPTADPSSGPSDTPTSIPTFIPTEDPSMAPTFAPTDAPTDIPTETPTADPSMTPTLPPTETPTEDPSETPTDSPTLAPTEEATAEPTFTPTTSAPTTFSPTQAVSFSISAVQTLNGVSLDDYESDSDTFDDIFADTVANTVGHGVSSSDVTVTGVSSPTPSPSGDDAIANQVYLTTLARMLGSRKTDSSQYDVTGKVFRTHAPSSSSASIFRTNAPTVLIRKTHKPSPSADSPSYDQIEAGGFTDTFDDFQAPPGGTTSAPSATPSSSGLVPAEPTSIPSLNPTMATTTAEPSVAADPTFEPTPAPSAPNAITLAYILDMSNATGFSTTDDAALFCSSQISAAVQDGSFTTSFQNNAVAHNATNFATVTSASVSVSIPTAPPTGMPTASTSDLSAAQVAGLTLLLVLMAVCTFFVPYVAIVIAKYRATERSKREERETLTNDWRRAFREAGEVASSGAGVTPVHPGRAKAEQHAAAGRAKRENTGAGTAV